MKRIIQDQGTGKTLQLLKYAQEKDAIFVCREPFAMKEKARALNINGLKFLGYNEAISRENIPTEDTLVVIDELELFVEFILTCGKLDGYNFSVEGISQA